MTCAWCGGTNPERGSGYSGGEWYCSKGCLAQARTSARHKGGGILNGLAQMAEGVGIGSGGVASFDNLAGGAGKVLGGLGKAAFGGLFGKKK